MRLPWILCTALLGPVTLSVNASTLCVSVADVADLPLSQAHVTIINLQTNTVSTLSTSPDGNACDSRLPEGLYSVEVGMPGFLNVIYYPVRISVPRKTELKFRLPFGEILEGGIAADAILSGTLTRQGEPAANIEICLREESGKRLVACTKTSDLGEYALSVSPGVYRVDLKGKDIAEEHSTLRIPGPGLYRNRIAFAHPAGKQ